MLYGLEVGVADPAELEPADCSAGDGIPWMAVVPIVEPDGIVVVEPSAEGPSVPEVLPLGLPALADPDTTSLALPDCKACAGVPGL